MDSMTAATLEYEQGLFVRRIKEHQLLRSLYHPRHITEFDDALNFRLAYHIARVATIAQTAGEAA